MFSPHSLKLIFYTSLPSAAFSSPNLLSFPSTPTPLLTHHFFSSVIPPLLLLSYPSTPSPLLLPFSHLW